MFVSEMQSMIFLFDGTEIFVSQLKVLKES